MSANIDLKSVNLKPLLKKLWQRFNRHAVFAVLFVILLSYVFVVYKTSQLANAEPGPDQQTVVTGSIPKIDKGAVDQIQSLEQSNTQIHALFDQARSNPFQE